MRATGRLSAANGPSPAERRESRIQRDRSHTEIYDRVGRVEVAVEGVEAAVEQAKVLAGDAVHRTDLLHQAVQSLEDTVLRQLAGKIDALVLAVGSEGEDDKGQKFGTGLVGRVMRLETYCRTRFGRYDRWVSIGIGVLGTLMVVGPVLWWLLGDKLALVLK